MPGLQHRAAEAPGIDGDQRGRPQRVVHASDDTDLKRGDCYDLVADLCSLPRPPRIPREQAARQLPAVTLSFMSESRRLAKDRPSSCLLYTTPSPRDQGESRKPSSA